MANWHAGPLCAWAIGAGIGLITTPKDALGLGLVKLTTIPTIDAVLAATLAMALIKYAAAWQKQQKTQVLPILSVSESDA